MKNGKTKGVISYHAEISVKLNELWTKFLLGILHKGLVKSTNYKRSQIPVSAYQNFTPIHSISLHFSRRRWCVAPWWRWSDIVNTSQSRVGGGHGGEQRSRRENRISVERRRSRRKNMTSVKRKRSGRENRTSVERGVVGGRRGAGGRIGRVWREKE